MGNWLGLAEPKRFLENRSVKIEIHGYSKNEVIEILRNIPKAVEDSNDKRRR